MNINKLKSITLLLVVFCGLNLAADSAEAQRRRKAPRAAKPSACSSVINLPDSKFIYKNSAPLRSGGVGTALVGYRVEPTLIMNSSAYSSRSSTQIFDSKGTLIGSCPWASAHGHSGGRFRCTMNTRNLRRAAIKNTKSASVFIRFKGTACVKVPDAGRCYGSVKGLCNQTLS